MPIYEFECPRCSHRFEDLLRSSRAKNPACPECGCVRTGRLMSTFSMGGSGSSAEASHSSSGCASCSSSSCAGCHH